MDSLDNTRPAPSASGFHEAVFIDSATTPADALMVVIPDFSADQPFGDPDGVVWSPMGGALPQAGDRALVAESTDGSWWVLSWWSDTQSTGVAESRVAALEATRTVRGVVSSAGAVVTGSGFSAARNSTGDYTVTFSPAFSGVPAVTLTLGSTGTAPRGIKHKDGVPATATAFSAWTYTVTPTLTDSEFHFIAVGPA